MQLNVEKPMKHQDSEEQLGGLHGGAAPAQFPLRLHDVLDASETEGFQHIVSWLPEGNGFQIHGADAMLPILQKYGFNQSRWKSFLRQLQNYGFRREIRGPTKGKCTHELFVKGRRELCQNMRRIRRSNSAETLQKNNKNSKKSRGGLTAQAIALCQEQMYARAALSAPTLGLLERGGSGGVSSSFAMLNLANAPEFNATKNGNASFNFVPSALPMTSRSSLPMSSKTGLLSTTTGRSRTNRKNLLEKGADQLIWDIQKELSKDSSMKSPTGYMMDPLGYNSPSSKLPLTVDGMNETEVNETMCSIFLTEPSLEETYDIM